MGDKKKMALLTAGIRMPRHAGLVMGLVLLAGGFCPPVMGSSYWRVEQSEVTAFVEGDRTFAERVLQTALRLRAAARGLYNWPESHREPPVLIVAVDESVLRSAFSFPRNASAPYTDVTSGHETWARTDELAVIAVSTGFRQGEGLRPLQHAYGEILVRAPATHDWPPCVQEGMAIFFTAADVHQPGSFLVKVGTVNFPLTKPGEPWNPVRFLVPNDPLHGLPQWELDQGLHSCLLMGLMVAASAPDQRIALENMLSAVGRGRPLAEAVASELGQSVREFDARYHTLNAYADVRLPLPDNGTPGAVPVASSAEAVRGLLGKLCEKLNNCRK